jgi:PncC family amidohydrolase
VCELEGGSVSLGLILTDRGLTLAVAESLTAGLVSGEIAAVAGASNYFLGGVVTYATAAKASVLGVAEEVLLVDGAVSEETARSMARGVRQLFGADIGLATTGVAGPDLQEGKPVGTLCIGVSMSECDLSCIQQIAPGSRNVIRGAAVQRAISFLLSILDSGRSRA